MNILLFQTDMSQRIYNLKLLMLIRKILQKSTDANVELLKLAKFDVPLFNEEEARLNFIPEDVEKMNMHFLSSDALIIATTQSAGSMSGVFKNIIDWMSHLNPSGLKKKHILLVNSDIQNKATFDALTHTKFSLEALENYIYPKSIIIDKANEKFDELGNLIDKVLLENVKSVLTSFIVFCQRSGLNHPRYWATY